MAMLKWVRCVYADGWHNAFTDLALWKGHHYVTFRSGIAHGSHEGKAVVMRSSNLQDWELCAAVSTEGDDRDPKFCATEEKLYLIFGSCHDSWHSPTSGEPPVRELAPFYSESTDGIRWSRPKQMYSTGYWLWRLYTHDGLFYSPAYHFPMGGRPSSAARVDLLRSDDLCQWDYVSTIMAAHVPNETALLFEGEKVTAVIRTAEAGGGPAPSWMATSQEPYTEWTAGSLGYTCNAPVLMRHKGELYVAGRASRAQLPAEHHFGEFESVTTLFRIVDRNAQPVLTLPSGGDTSYCGMAEGPDDSLLISYYSQHETVGGWPEGSNVTPARIYLAAVSLP